MACGPHDRLISPLHLRDNAVSEASMIGSRRQKPFRHSARFISPFIMKNLDTPLAYWNVTPLPDSCAVALEIYRTPFVSTFKRATARVDTFDSYQ